MIPLMKNAFVNEEDTKQKLAEFIRTTKRFSMGEQCLNFEEKFGNWQGRKYAILFSSGGAANLALIQALKNLQYMEDGGAVGFSSLTWATNVMPLIQLGLKPIAIDCTPATLNIDPICLCGEGLQILFITNALGFASDMQNIQNYCEEWDIILIEDNCEALGTELNGIKTGNFGAASTFSFYVAHHLSTIEGGMVCTDDQELADMLKMVRANGWDRDLSLESKKKIRKKYNISEFDAKYTFYEPGYNLRPTEITGFLGCNQIHYLEDNITKRAQNHLVLEAAVKNNSDLIVIDHSHISRLSPYAFPILCGSPEIKKQYVEKFNKAKIEIRPMIAGQILNQPFYKTYVNSGEHLPGTDFIDTCGFYCGNYPQLTDDDLDKISQCLRN